MISDVNLEHDGRIAWTFAELGVFFDGDYPMAERIVLAEELERNC